jgi:hypothetical protein
LSRQTRDVAALRRAFAAAVEEEVSAGRSLNRIALEVGLSRPGVQKLLSDPESELRGPTQQKLEGWLQRRQLQAERTALVTFQGGGPGDPEGEREVMSFFLGNHRAVAGFLGSLMREVPDPRQRKLIAHTVITSVKRAALERGEEIPQELWELERKFLEGG